MDEQQLNDVFGRAVDGAVPELDRLVAGAETDGQRLRVRRRAAVAGAVLTVAAVAIGGGLMLRPGTSDALDLAAAGPGAGFPAGPAGSPAPAGVATGTPSPSVSAPSDLVPLTGQAIAYKLTGLLPGYVLGDFAGMTTPGTTRTEATGRVMVRLGAGMTPVGVNVQSDFLHTGGAPGTTPAERIAAHYDCSRTPQVISCITRKMLDGSIMMLTDQSEEPGVIVRFVDVYRPDGVRILVSCSNSADDKRPPVLAEEPALTFEKLTEIATSPAWQTRITPESAAFAAAKVLPYRDLNG